MANPGLSFRTPAAVVVNATPADSMWDAPPADGTLAEFGRTLFVRTAGAWVAQIGAGDLLAANNLNDVANVAAAAHNLGLGTADSPTFTTLTLSGSVLALPGLSNKTIAFAWTGFNQVVIGSATRGSNGDSLRLGGSIGAPLIDLQCSGASNIGFFGAVPVPQPAAATDVVEALIALGLLAEGETWPLNLGTGALVCGQATFADPQTLAAAGTVWAGLQVTGDTFDRYQITPAGAQLGGGSGATDVRFYRSSAANLVIDSNGAGGAANLGVSNNITGHSGLATAVTLGADTLTFHNGEAGSALSRTAANTLTLGTTGAAIVILASSGGSLGFYGHAGVAQPAAPVTLADVIAVIRGCGLSA